MLHTYPINDLFEHELEGTGCWCEPHVDWDQPAEALVIHHAADGRDLWEQQEAERRKGKKK
jgi:hypothetical protein